MKKEIVFLISFGVFAKLIRDLYGINPFGFFNSLPSFIYVLGGCLIWEEICVHMRWKCYAGFPFFLGSLLYEYNQLFYSGTFSILDLIVICFGYVIYLLIRFSNQRRLRRSVRMHLKDPIENYCAPSD